MISRYGPGPHKPEDLEEGLLVIDEHTQSIVDATFSPEGSALATVSLDGTIRFFQVIFSKTNLSLIDFKISWVSQFFYLEFL